MTAQGGEQISLDWEPPGPLRALPEDIPLEVLYEDDDLIAVYDAASASLVDRIRNIEEPETFDLHPDGSLLYVSNEEDATASVVDLATRKVIHTVDLGEEPEGVLFTSDGATVYVASFSSATRRAAPYRSSTARPTP